MAGKVAGLGSAKGNALRQGAATPTEIKDLRTKVVKHAILNALGLDLAAKNVRDLSVIEFDGGLVSVKASGLVQKAMWKHHIVAIRTTVTEDNGHLHCTAVRMSGGGAWG